MNQRNSFHLQKLQFWKQYTNFHNKHLSLKQMLTHFSQVTLNVSQHKTLLLFMYWFLADKVATEFGGRTFQIAQNWTLCQTFYCLALKH